MRLIVLLCIGAWCCTGYAQDGPVKWVTAGAYGDMHIVISKNPSETLQYAAELFQKHWKACTDRELKISAVNEGLVNVWLGRESLTPDLLLPSELDGLGEEGCLIKTYTPPRRALLQGANKQLIIAGATDRGTLNGVFEFFSQYMGVRWLAPGVTLTPPKGYVMHEIGHRFVPAFAFREVGYHHLWPDTGVEYRRAHHFPPEILDGPFGGHTFYQLLPPDQYFEQHPEYYAEIKGRRVAYRGAWADEAVRSAQPGQAGQLCCGNPATADAVLASLLELIKADPATADPALLARRNAVCPHPDKKVWSVSQMDWLRPCQCALCREIDEREGSPMGSLLTLVNRVAEGAEQAFPDAGYKIHTFAYQYSRKPPKTLRARANVIVQVCSIECDFARPLDDRNSPINAAFVQDLDGWSRSAEHLYIWDYVANFTSGLRPHPNLHVLQSNIRLFDQYGVEGVYEQAVELPAWPSSDCDALRSYLLSEFLWDPDFSYDEARSTFLREYYGPAAALLGQYLDLMADAVVAKGVYLGCFAEPYWWDYDLVTKAEELFQQALAAKLSDTERQRVEQARLPVQYAALVCPPRIRAEGAKLVFERPPSLTLEEYGAALARLGETVKERPVRDPLPGVVRDCGGSTPPRREEYTLEVLENERYLVWVAPELRGAILRWRDKQLGVEMLRGFENYGSGPGVWQEWKHQPCQPEGPVADQYEVIERAPERLVLRATLEGGVVLTRTLRLAPGSDRLDYGLTLENPGSTPVEIPVKVHPEFFSQGASEPEIWAQVNGAWKRLEGNEGYSGAFWNARYRPAAGITSWAFHVPENSVTVFNDFDPAQAEQVLFYYNATHARRQVNIEIILPQKPLEPGEIRRLDLEYRTANTPPR
jgi:hypothetical protein